MKFVVIFAMVSVFAVPAVALVDDGINSLGVCFDADGELNCYGPSPFTPFNVYFILAHPTAASLGGYEFAWRFSPPLVPAPFILSRTLVPGAVNAGRDDNLLVTVPGGFVTTEATVLATFSLITLAQVHEGEFITVGPATPASLPGQAAFTGFLDAAPTAVAYHGVPDWATIDPQGWVVPGVAALWCVSPGPAVETATWSEVKSLFR